MRTGPEGLFWRRTGWSEIVALGVLAGLITTAISLESGFHAGFSRGVQTFETGQVEIQSLHGGISEYGLIAELAQQITGVVATSPRLDFTASLTNSSGETRLVHIRACYFAQEDRVTSLLGRFAPSGLPLSSGLVLSRALSADPTWNRASMIRISSPTKEFESRVMPVSGHVAKTAGVSLDQISFMDLDSARRLLGSGLDVSSIAVKLDTGLKPDKWVAAHRSVFQRYDTVPKTWRELSASDKYFEQPSVVLGALDWLLNGVSILACLAILLIGVRSRQLRSGLQLLLRSEKRNWRRALALSLGVSAATALVFFVLGPVYQDWLLSGLHGEYPFLAGPALPWGWTWAAIGVPAGAEIVALTIVFLPHKRPSETSPFARPQPHQS